MAHFSHVVWLKFSSRFLSPLYILCTPPHSPVHDKLFTNHIPMNVLCSYKTNVRDLVEITNKMQPCIRIYYSTVHWRLNMFRAAHRSSSGAPTLFSSSGLHTHVATGRSQVWVGTVPTQTWLRPVTTCVCKPEAANTVGAPDDERCAARNMLSLQWTVE